MTKAASTAIAETPIGELQIKVRKAARAMARHGLVHAFGHVSARLNNEEFLVCAPRPMGCIAPGEDGTRVPINGELPAGVLPEVRIHQQIYRARPDVGGICRVQPPRLMALSTLKRTPLVRNGSGTYFAPRAPLWDDPLLARTNEKAQAIAEKLENARAIVMRGNGAVCVGATIEEAACMAYFLEDAAMVELDVLQVNADVTPAFYTPEEIAARAVSTGGIYDRMWEFLTFGDPEP